MESQRTMKVLFILLSYILYLDVFANGASTWNTDTQFGEVKILGHNEIKFNETASLKYHFQDKPRDTTTGFDWPDNFIPFVIDASVLDYPVSLTDISGSQDEISSETCLKFRAKEANDNIWVRYSIDSEEANCVSYLILPTSANQQEINLTFSPKCTRVDIFHETLHALEILENPTGFSGTQDDLPYPLDNPAALGDPNMAKYRRKLANSDLQLIRTKYKCTETETTHASSNEINKEETSKTESDINEENDEVNETSASSQIQISTTDTTSSNVVNSKPVPTTTTATASTFANNSPPKPSSAPAKPSCIFPMKPPFC